jgi:DNA-binding response OmpR family regulator
MANPKVLIIDDDIMTCRLIETFLQMDGFKTSSVNRIGENNIIPILDREKPDLVFMIIIWIVRPNNLLWLFVTVHNGKIYR